MTDRLALEFVTSAAEVSALPESPAEVAIAGRSNVGKSTLLNALAGRDGLARTSKAPGRTRLLNCYATPSGATVVDLPGFGYAKVAKQERAAWDQRMRRYLSSRGALRTVLLLIDGEIGPTERDREVLAWMRGHDVPLVVVATKHDKVRSSHRQRRRRDLAQGCGLAPDEVLWVSAQRGVNVGRLRALVAELLGEPSG